MDREFAFVWNHIIALEPRAAGQIEPAEHRQTCNLLQFCDPSHPTSVSVSNWSQVRLLPGGGIAFITRMGRGASGPSRGLTK